MTTTNFLFEQWKVSVTACCSSLERNDLRRVSVMGTLDDVRDQFPIPKSSSLHHSALQEFAMLSRDLENLRRFADFISAEADPNIDLSILWGSIGLIVKLSQEGEGLAPRIPRMLRDVCNKIEILSKYWDDSTGILPQTKEASFDVVLVLLPFLFATIKFIREDGEYFSSDKVWQPLDEHFASVISDIVDAVSRLEKLSQIAQRSGPGYQGNMSRVQSGLTASTLSSGPSEEKASLPCFIFPASRTVRFFDRADTIADMREYFDYEPTDPDNSFQSLALYGLGGVGKSTVALKFAESRLHRDELDALLWVSSEKEVSIKQSFTDIAVRLKLPGADPKDQDENRTLVLDWLQKTKCRWLIIYDNVESIDVLLTYWPTATRGQALITTRNPNAAFHPADRGLEITSWDPETGTQFLLHLLSTDIRRSLTSDEATSAHELSFALSGHALAISHMAGLIYRRSWSISEFLEMYKKMPNKVHGISGNNSINALWDFSFRSLSDQSRAILGVLSFLAPDSIPQAIFGDMDEQMLPDSLKFCADPFLLSEVMENLLTIALIKRDQERRAFSVHRLVQTAFKYFLTQEQRQQSFNDAVILVAHAFPKRDPKFFHMFHNWKRCSLYLQHVLSLRDFFREELKANKDFAAPASHCRLNTDCQRYLLEVNAFDNALDLIEVNTLAIATMPKQSHTVEVNLKGVLASHKGQILARIGRVEEGVKYLKIAYDTLATDEPFDPCNLAWEAENSADGFATLNNFSEAVKWQEKARDLWLEYNKTEWPAMLKKHMGTALLWAGQRERAREILAEGMKQLTGTEPYYWALAAFYHYEIGNLDRLDRNFEAAEAHYMEAQNKWLTGDNLRSDPFNGAVMYKIGCLALDQGKVEAAIKHLRDSLVVTTKHRVRMVAEHARTLFKLSEALWQESGGDKEALLLQDEVERLLLVRDPSAVTPWSEQTFDQLVYILWR